MKIELQSLCQLAADQYDSSLQTDAAVLEVNEYIVDRLRGYYQDKDISFDVVDAVIASGSGVMADLDQRVTAVHEFLREDAAIALAAANKRIANILKKQSGDINTEVNPELFEAAEEKALFEQLDLMSAAVAQHFSEQDYLSGLNQLSGLRPVVDEFFDHVMVMAEDPRIRDNRLALLSTLVQQFRQVADFSRLQG